MHASVRIDQGPEAWGCYRAEFPQLDVRTEAPTPVPQPCLTLSAARTRKQTCEHYVSNRQRYFLNFTSRSSAGLNKKALVDLVLQQFECWPHDTYRWVPKRDTTVEILRNVLLDPAYGFGSAGSMCRSA